jgi:hypothetical protein
MKVRHPGPACGNITWKRRLSRRSGCLVENASDEDLRELSEAPSAHWEAINAFLDENVAAEPGPRQDVALALDSFSQAAMEARYELEGRRSS